MRADEAPAVLAKQAAELRAAGDRLDTSAMVHAAREVAATVRQQALHAGQHVGIRVVARHNGVRLTVTGPHASKYRGLVERELGAKAPQVRAEIRAQITRRAK